MNSLLVLAHPEPQSFTSAMFRQAQVTLAENGHHVQTSDLYAQGFDPVSDRRNFTTTFDSAYLKPQAEERHASVNTGFAPDLETEMRKLEQADLLILHFPLWWFSMPAILKGWVDRVFASGRIYGGGRMYEQGQFAGRRAMLTLTTGGPDRLYADGGFHGDIDHILRPIERGILQFVGYDVLPAHIVFSPASTEPEAREAALTTYATRLRGLAAETPRPALSYSAHPPIT